MSNELDKKVNIGEGQEIIAMYLANTRIASGLENNEAGSEKMGMSIGGAWEKAYVYLDMLIEKEPRHALDLAVVLSLLPRSSKNEDVYKWIRSEGPVTLANPRLMGKLTSFLNSDPKAIELTERIREYIRFDVSEVSSDEVFSNPESFLAMASIYLGTKLGECSDCEHATDLFQLATERLKDGEVLRVVNSYTKFEETAWIANDILEFKNNLE